MERGTLPRTRLRGTASSAVAAFAEMKHEYAVPTSGPAVLLLTDRPSSLGSASVMRKRRAAMSASSSCPGAGPCA
jgi:hypothetical protein